MSDRLAALVAALRAELKRALKGRDAAAIAALRSVLGALDNANAQSVESGSAPTAAATSTHIAGAVAGLGAGEVERRSLSDAEVDAILTGEIADRQAQVDVLDAAGRDLESAMARYQVKLLSRFQGELA